jgi:hypothetical protein
MDCPHCGKAFHDSWTQVSILTIGDTPRHTADGNLVLPGRPYIEWKANATICPACQNPTITLLQCLNDGDRYKIPTVFTRRAYPTNTFRKPTPKEVPAHIKEDYEEACGVLPISQKASAALSRRCLQAILQGQGYTQRDLAVQINALLSESDPTKAIPTTLRETVDVIRNFGNFSAHLITDQTTLQIIPVEPHEAEWCLDILEDMFDHYYVKPAEAKARKAALDAKLTAAGKPRSK